MTSGRDRRFWLNVALIAVAHVALIAGLIRWSLAARASSNPESIVWLGSAGDLAIGESEKQESPSPKPATPPLESKPEQEKSVAPAVKSEIELPSPIPRPTPTATPHAKPTETPTPKPIPKPTPKKALVAKATPASLREAAAGSAPPKPSSKEKSNSAKVSDKPEKKLMAKNESQSQSGSGRTSLTGKVGHSDGGNSPAAAGEFSWYGNMLHDRFYSAWIQPTANIATGTKISTLVKVRIEKDGRVSKFEIVKPSENIVVNESVEAVAKRVTEVDAPPAGLIKGDHYDVKINFELSTDRETETP